MLFRLLIHELLEFSMLSLSVTRKSFVMLEKKTVYSRATEINDQLID